MRFLIPTPLVREHDVQAFSCGEPVLDDWLQKKALKAHSSRSARVFVLLTNEAKVAAYFALANGALARHDALGSVRRNMPNPIPVMVLARFAVDVSFQGKGIGRELLHDAVLRTLAAANIAGIRAMVVHALNDGAKVFYENNGFTASKSDPYLLMMKLP